MRTTDIIGLSALATSAWRRPLMISEDGHPLHRRLFHACSTQKAAQAHTHTHAHAHTHAHKQKIMNKLELNKTVNKIRG